MTGQLAIDTNALGPWRSGQPDTARQAALANYPRSGSQRARVLDALRAAGADGLTAFEAAERAGIVRMHTASTRLAELVDAGLAVRTAATRPTDTGSAALVWVAVGEGS